MSKAEKLSQNRYPTMAEKYAFIDGYEQAKKDLELTVDDIRLIDDLLMETNDYQEALKQFKEWKEK